MAAISSSTAAAAAVASGLPPKVDAWGTAPPVGVVRPAAARSVTAIAPIGTPPPRPLASVITSGVTPSCSWPHQRPVRPVPVWTSSKISSTPAASQASRSPRR